MMKRHLPFTIIAVAFLAVLGSGTALYFWKEGAQKSKKDFVKEPPVRLGPGAEPAHIRGPAAAGVKI